MKRNLLVGLLTVGFVVSAFSQGTVIFNNALKGQGVFSPVYGPNTANPSEALTGNTAAGVPVGTQTYPGAFLSGAGYSAQLWAAPTTGTTIAPETSLVGAANATTVFRTGTAIGFVQAPATAYALAGIAKDAAVATLQLRVWDNSGGIDTWDKAVTRTWGFGKSTLFNVGSIGGDLNAPPVLVGLTSFNITGQPGAQVPEPSSFALAGLGAAALLIFRRRK